MGVKVGRVLALTQGGGDVSPLTESSEEVGRSAAEEVELVVRDEEGESSLRFGSGNPRFGMWVEYLSSRRDAGTPVYVESDEDNQVLSVLPSYLYTVEAIEDAPDGGSLVCFLQSPAVSPLRESHPHYEDLRALLSNAAESHSTLLVTCEPDDREIVDARQPPPPDVSNGPVAPVDFPLGEGTPPALFNALTPDVFESHLTLSEALLAFDFVASIPELEIPFKYPVDCCVARAHMMCRFLHDRFGIAARKLWNYGTTFPAPQASLRFDTSNHPNGFAPWRYHVAPVVSVRDFPARFLILDPSMFIVRPVTVEQWLAAQNDPGARQSHSTARAFTHVPTGEETFDDPLRSTNDQLDGHRLAWRALRARFFDPLPPPA